jgi:hypothetical protein
MAAEGPPVARLRARFAGRSLEGGIEVERLRAFALLAGVEAAQEVVDFILSEARQAEIGRTARR